MLQRQFKILSWSIFEPINGVMVLDRKLRPNSIKKKKKHDMKPSSTSQLSFGYCRVGHVVFVNFLCIASVFLLYNWLLMVYDIKVF